MRKSPLLIVFSFALLLAACGGGGSGGGGTVPSTPVPTATPAGTPTPTPTPTPISGAGLPLVGPSTDPNGDWGPPGVASALNFPVNNGTPTYDGTGQTVAVVIDSDVKRSDLNTFFTYFQIPTTSRTITTRSVDGATGVVGLSQDEATLDVETVAGLAPGANVIIYQIPGLDDQSITDAYTAVVADKKAFVVNSSFGGCELASPAPAPPYPTPPEDVPIASGAAAGVSFLASSGDNGNLCNYDPKASIKQVGASWPASNPHVIGVGGTETWNGAALTSHELWNDNWCTNCGGSGFVSQLYTIPTYQTASILSGCTSPPSGSPCSTTMRNEPDISFPGVDAGIIENGRWAAIAGTSWSSPEAAALYAELYQYCNANGGPIPGVTEPASIAYYVYSQAATNFIDVNGGTNQMAGTTPFYTAFAGFDVASGLGVPKGYQFVQTACPAHVPAAGLARTRMSFASVSGSPAHTSAYTIDVTPRVLDISDQGVRNGDEPTRIQLVMQPENAALGESAAIAALRVAGFTIVQTFSNHLVVDAVGPSSAVERFFRTRMHNVWQGQYGTRYLPTTQIVVPDSLAPYVSGIRLDNVIKYHHRLSRI